MLTRYARWVALVCLLAACGQDFGTEGSSYAGDEHGVAEQPVIIEPVFIIDGLDDLPAGLVIDEVHLGIGAIFLELIEGDETGIAFANRDPFHVFFDLGASDTAGAPTMTLPQGGRYLVSVQVEPQMLDGGAVEPTRTASVNTDPVEGSFAASGMIYQTEIVMDDPTVEEPIPLPWYPEANSVSGLRANVTGVPFEYVSSRTVRFVLDEVTLEGGTSHRLMLHIDLGNWVRDTIHPVLAEAMGTDMVDGSTIGTQTIDVSAALDGLDDDLDSLLGDIDVEVR